MKLEITKERILEAASKCSTAKETLKTLFPEVFEEDKYFDFSGTPTYLLGMPTSILVRKDGNFTNRGFYLSTYCNWEIVKDDQGQLVLVPTKKQ